MLSDRCLSCPVCLSVCLSLCLSVTLVYCGQKVGLIKVTLDVEIGLGQGHIVLDGDPAPLHVKGHRSRLPLFDPCLLWPNGRPSQLLLSSCTNGRPKMTCPNFTKFSARVTCGRGSLLLSDNKAIRCVLPVSCLPIIGEAKATH